MLTIGIIEKEINIEKLKGIKKAVKKMPDDELLIFYIFLERGAGFEPSKVLPLLASWINGHTVKEFKESFILAREFTQQGEFIGRPKVVEQPAPDTGFSW